MARETSIQLLNWNVEQARHGRAGLEANAHLRRRIKSHAEQGWSEGSVWRLQLSNAGISAQSSAAC